MFRFVQSDFVAAGTFNIYVLQPDWFTELGLFISGPKVRLHADLSRPGYRFSQQDSEVEWTITPEKVVAASRARHENCGAAIGKVIETLEWTPLIAVGGNVMLRADETDRDSIPFQLFVPDLSPDFTWKNSSSVVTVTRGGRDFRIALTRDGDGCQITANIHTDLSRFLGREQKLAAARNACESFLSDQRTAFSLIEQFYGVGIENDDCVRTA
ncbi:MAG: hypothetical protein WBC44_14350 [Planctomycetaceae bacterium]